jgi:hypothetical protein
LLSDWSGAPALAKPAVADTKRTASERRQRAETGRGAGRVIGFTML